MSARYGASICERKHVLSKVLGHEDWPDDPAFCPTCGASAVRSCLRCGTTILGLRKDFDSGFGITNGLHPAFAKFSVPDHCSQCGSSFPWREAEEDALKELVELMDVDAEERRWLGANVPALLASSPRTGIAVERWKRAISTMTDSGKEVAKEVVTSVLGDAIKKALGLG